MKLYVKFLIALLGGIGAWGVTAAADNGITLVEWFTMLGPISTALAVLAFPNEQPDS